MTKEKMIGKLLLAGYLITAHYRQNRTDGYKRLYIDSIEEKKFTTANSQQTQATKMLKELIQKEGLEDE